MKNFFFILSVIILSFTVCMPKKQPSGILTGNSTKKQVCFNISNLIKNHKGLRFDSIPILYDTTKDKSRFVTNYPQIYDSLKFSDEPLSHTFLINKYFDISHTINRFFHNNKTRYISEYITILNQKFYLTDLFSNTVNGKESEQFVKFTQGYKFFHKNQNFVILIGEHRFPSFHYAGLYKILFDITNENRVKVYAFLDSYTRSNEFLADFNDDGKLDYIYYPLIENTLINIERLKKNPRDTLKLYSLINNSFSLDAQHYVVIKHISGENPKCNGKIIDVKNSKWFFNLEK